MVGPECPTARLTRVTTLVWGSQNLSDRAKWRLFKTKSVHGNVSPKKLDTGQRR
jgi:hypothetical protein